MVIKNKIPYFYIIRNKQTNIRYAGCKYGKDADPDMFMKIGGYTTSSKTINSIIKDEGLDMFEIEQLICESEINRNIKDYETDFLISNNCKTSSLWYNKHDNHFGEYSMWQSQEFKQSIIEKYGVDHIMKLESKKIQMMNNLKKSNLENYNVEFTSQREDVKEKANQSRIKYNLETYGVENTLQREDVKQKIKDTNLKKYGVEYISQNENIKNKTQLSKLNNLKEKYGEHITNVFQLDDVKEKLKLSWKDRKVTVCPNCGKTSKNKSVMTRWHFENCKNK